MRKENICRKIVESLFNRSFPTIRPDFLRNPKTNRNLEIDCYCEELGIGIEYNGIQHYKFPNRYHRSINKFNKQLERDEIKKHLCNVNNIILIIIPYTVKIKNIESFIIKELSKNDNIIIENI